ncbi:hypothetical protein EDC01DRAFT_629733 [Geopyxis carbonaria]|nr:hypothetical protein EDC01DRAFT_629733 [Geopyxis carbonaria]
MSMPRPTIAQPWATIKRVVGPLQVVQHFIETAAPCATLLMTLTWDQWNQYNWAGKVLDPANVRYYYDSREDVELLRVSKPTAIHECINAVLSEMMPSLTTWMTHTELELEFNCTWGSGGVTMKPPYVYHAPRCEEPDSRRTPDQAFRPLYSRLPTIVFEIGLNENPKTLVAEAHQWFDRTGGQVKVLIVVDVQEDLESLQDYRNARVRHKSHHNDIMSISGEQEIDVHYYVGKLSASLQIWRYNDDKRSSIHTLDADIAFLPWREDIDRQKGPLLYIRDFVSPCCDYEPPDLDREFPLDLAIFRRSVIEARQKLAYERRQQQWRKKSKTEREWAHGVVANDVVQGVLSQERASKRPEDAQNARSEFDDVVNQKRPSEQDFNDGDDARNQLDRIEGRNTVITDPRKPSKRRKLQTQ